MSDNNTYCRCLYYSANALARTITKMAEEEFAVVDLAPSYAFMVMAVNRNPGIQAGELADIMMLTPSTVSRLVDRLESRQLVKKHTEGRLVLIYPTPKSVEINDSIKAAWFKLYQRYVAVLGAEAAVSLTENIYSTALKLEKG